MAATQPTIHASAVLLGVKATLIRGPAGSGKSNLVWDLLHAGLPFARLIADDRVFAEAHHGKLLVRPAKELAGLIEVRGVGIRSLAFEPLSVANLVIDLAAPDGSRHPEPNALKTEIAGIALPRLAVAPGANPLPAVLAWLSTDPAAN